MTTISHLRSIPSLRPLRGHHPAVVVCLDDPAAYEALAGDLVALEGRLIVEREPGELSAQLGRPSVTVCDRFLGIELHGEDVSPEDVLKTVRLLEMRCDECPQSGVDMHQSASDWA